MKAIAIILLLLLSCGSPDDSEMGCQTGVIKGTSIRVTIRCCTENQHEAGNNVTRGGTANFTDFTNVKWVPINDCKNCY